MDGAGPSDARVYFSETVVSPGRNGRVRFLFSVDETLFKGHSEFQEIEVFRNDAFGRILALDGIIQFSELDECVYHEMLVHPLLLSHPDPQRLLIVGGGDGGSLRECLKHAPVEVVLVEIDRQVIEVAQRFLPFTAAGVFGDRRLRLRIGDAAVVIKECADAFDAIVVDCADDVGPSAVLFEQPFYVDVAHALGPGGVAAFQVGSFLDTELIQKVMRQMKQVFRFQTVYRFTMPVYNDGDYCFVAGSQAIDLAQVPLETLEGRLARVAGGQELRYYTPAIHRASQVLPPMYQSF